MKRLEGETEPDLTDDRPWNLLVLGLGVWLALAFVGMKWVLIGIAVLGMILASLILSATYRSLRLPRTLAWDVIPAGADDLPKEVHAEWHTADVEFSREGLQRSLTVRMLRGDHSTATYQALWSAPGRPFWVESVVVTSTAGEALAFTRSVRTLGVEQRILETSTSRPFHPTPTIRAFDVAAFESLWDWQSLIHVHVARLDRWESRPVNLDEANAIPHAQSIHESFCRALVAQGFVRASTRSDAYWPTFRGVLIWSTFHFPVIKQVALALQRARSSVLLESLGLHGKPVHWWHWLALGGGAMAMGFGTTLPWALPIACLACAGMLGIRTIVRRRGTPVAARHALLGGCLGILAVPLLLYSQVLLSGEYHPPLLAGSSIAVGAMLGPYLGAFVAGPAALLWGWTHIPYLGRVPTIEMR